MSTNTLFLPAEQQLTVTADANSSGFLTQLPLSAGDAVGATDTIAVSTTTVKGPYADPRYYKVQSDTGLITTAIARSLDFNSETFDSTQHTLESPLLTSAGVGAKNGATVTVVEEGDGVNHKTTFTLTATPLSVVSVTTGNGVGGIKIYDMPEGYIKVTGCTSDLSLGVTTQADFTDGTPEGQVAIGTLAPANADALGTDATDDNIGTATDFTMTAYVDADVNIPPEADLLFDGTSTAMDVIVNGLVDAADIDDDTTTNLEVTGTVTLTWINLGDFEA